MTFGTLMTLTNLTTLMTLIYKNVQEHTVQGIGISRHAYRSNPLQVDMFLSDKDHTLENVQSAISNFVTMLSFIYETNVTKTKKVPLIIHYSMEVLRLTHSRPFDKWFKAHYVAQRWIPHTILALIHDIIRNFSTWQKKTGTNSLSCTTLSETNPLRSSRPPQTLSTTSRKPLMRQ